MVNVCTCQRLANAVAVCGTFAALVKFGYLQAVVCHRHVCEIVMIGRLCLSSKSMPSVGQELFT